MAQNGDIPLTPRQLELLAAVASGKTIDQAAERTYMQPRSAYNMLSMARKNSGCATVVQLAIKAVTSGWIEDDGEGNYAPAANLQPA